MIGSIKFLQPAPWPTWLVPKPDLLSRLHLDPTACSWSWFNQEMEKGMIVDPLGWPMFFVY